VVPAPVTMVPSFQDGHAPSWFQSAIMPKCVGQVGSSLHFLGRPRIGPGPDGFVSYLPVVTLTGPSQDQGKAWVEFKGARNRLKIRTCSSAGMPWSISTGAFVEECVQPVHQFT
jgi:hypothetical protein